MQRDLYLRRGAAWNAVIWALNSIGVVLLLWASSVEADTAQAGSDYLWPAQANGGFISAPVSIESGQTSAGKSSTTTYQAFDGISYQLVENRGRYVNVLVPESFDDGPFFTGDHIEEMVDRLDMLYALYIELLHDQPAGNDLLIIAFVPQTCGMGCGLVGARGFEVLSERSNYEAIIRELDNGRLEPVLMHELAHNFDAFSKFLHYLPDHPHAWTNMFEFFAPYRYSRVSSHGEAPDDLYNSPVSSVWKEYVTEEHANWERCVQDDSCGDLGLSANSLWAMLYYRVETLHGIDAILDSFEFLQNYTKTKPAPKTDEEKEGVRILSLAAGAGANISCYMDSLKWPIEAAVRAELEQKYGSGNVLCDDQDGDGFSAVNGDCDDKDATRNIAAIELSHNGVDDDCDELVDEVSLIELDAATGSGDFQSQVQTRLPFEVEGTADSTGDEDSFSFSVPASGRVRVTLCAQGGFVGWVVALQANGDFLDDPNYYSYRPEPGCVSNTFDFEDATTAGLAVMPDESAGGYSLIVSPAVALLPDHSSLMQVSANTSGGMNLHIDDSNGLLSSLGADEVEIWISGVGAQLFEPFSDTLNVQLNTVTVPSLQNGETYQVRIRPRANGLPLAAFSAGHLFRYENTPATLPAIDHRFSGAWFDSGHDGEGFIVEILDDMQALIYWFTYQDDGAQRWMLGMGNVEGNRIVVGELIDARGGRFGANFNPDDVVLNTVGSLSLSFLDCSTALVNYSVDENGGHQSTSRLIEILGHSCNSSAQAPDSGLSGSWYDPSHDGEGFIVEQFSADDALVIWFTYDDAGGQSWMLNSGTVNGNTILFPQLVQPVGGHFGRSYDPQSVTRNDWGELTLELDCSGGRASYRSQSTGYSNGSQSLLPLTQLAGSTCPDP